MSLLLAILFLATGIFCINRPNVLVGWIATLLKGAGNKESPPWLGGSAIRFFIRLLGFLALINATMYFYLAQHGNSGITL